MKIGYIDDGSKQGGTDSGERIDYFKFFFVFYESTSMTDTKQNVNYPCNRVEFSRRKSIEN